MEDTRKLHLGRNIKKLRQLKGLKQEALAIEMGISQTAMSEIENSEMLDDAIIIKIAHILNISPEIIKEFNEYSAFYSINNIIENSQLHDSAQGIHQVFSPIEKVVELYERLLASEKEKVEILKSKIKS